MGETALPPQVEAWLRGLGALDAEAASASALSSGALMLRALRGALGEGAGAVAVREDSSPAARAHNWSAAARLLKAAGIEVDEDAKLLLVAGDTALAATLLGRLAAAPIDAKAADAKDAAERKAASGVAATAEASARAPQQAEAVAAAATESFAQSAGEEKASERERKGEEEAEQQQQQQQQQPPPLDEQPPQPPAPAAAAAAAAAATEAPLPVTRKASSASRGAAQREARIAAAVREAIEEEAMERLRLQQRDAAAVAVAVAAAPQPSLPPSSDAELSTARSQLSGASSQPPRPTSASQTPLQQLLEMLSLSAQRHLGLPAAAVGQLLAQGRGPWAASALASRASPESFASALEGWLGELHNISARIGGVCAAADQQALVLLCAVLQPGLAHQAFSVALLTCRVLTRIGADVLRASPAASETLWRWFSAPGGGLSALVCDLYARAPAESRGAVIAALQVFGQRRLFALLGPVLHRVLPVASDYLAFAIDAVSGLADADATGATRATLEMEGAVDALADFAHAHAEASDADAATRVNAMVVLTRLWTLFGEGFEARANNGQGVLALLKKGLRDASQTVQAAAARSLFLLLDSFIARRHANASEVYKTLIFALVEHRADPLVHAHLRRGMLELLPRHAELPVHVIVEPLVKQYALPDAPLADAELFAALARHPRLQLRHAMLLMHLMGKLALKDAQASREVAASFVAVAQRFAAAPAMAEYVDKYARVALSLLMRAVGDMHQRPPLPAHAAALASTAALHAAPPADADARVFTVSAALHVLGRLAQLHAPAFDASLSALLGSAQEEHVALYGTRHRALDAVAAILRRDAAATLAVDAVAATAPLLPPLAPAPPPRPPAQQQQPQQQQERRAAATRRMRVTVPAAAPGDEIASPHELSAAAPAPVAAQAVAARAPQPKASTPKFSVRASPVARLAQTQQQQQQQQQQPSADADEVARRIRAKAEAELEELRQRRAERLRAEQEERERAARREEATRKRLQELRQLQQQQRREGAGAGNVTAAVAGAASGGAVSDGAASGGEGDIMRVPEFTAEAQQVMRKYARGLRALFRAYVGRRPAGHKAASFEQLEQLGRSLSIGDFVLFWQDVSAYPTHISKAALLTVFHVYQQRQELDFDAFCHALWHLAHHVALPAEAQQPHQPATAAAATAAAPLERLLAFVKEQSRQRKLGPPGLWDAQPRRAIAAASAAAAAASSADASPAPSPEPAAAPAMAPAAAQWWTSPADEAALLLELNARVAADPSAPLPPGFQKVLEDAVTREPVLPAGASEAETAALSLVDSILAAAVGVELLERQERRTQRVVVQKRPAPPPQQQQQQTTTTTTTTRARVQAPVCGARRPAEAPAAVGPSPLAPPRAEPRMRSHSVPRSVAVAKAPTIAPSPTARAKPVTQQQPQPQSPQAVAASPAASSQAAGAALHLPSIQRRREQDRRRREEEAKAAALAAKEEAERLRRRNEELKKRLEQEKKEKEEKKRQEEEKVQRLAAEKRAFEAEALRVLHAMQEECKRKVAEYRERKRREEETRRAEEEKARAAEQEERLRRVREYQRLKAEKERARQAEDAQRTAFLQRLQQQAQQTPQSPVHGKPPRAKPQRSPIAARQPGSQPASPKAREDAKPLSPRSPQRQQQHLEKESPQLQPQQEMGAPQSQPHPTPAADTPMTGPQGEAEQWRLEAAVPQPLAAAEDTKAPLQPEAAPPAAAAAAPAAPELESVPAPEPEPSKETAPAPTPKEEATPQ